MAPRLPPLNPLRAFEATARHGSLSKAAAELNVTHGAVSHQLRSLEEAMRVRLFERTGRRLRLTPSGAELLPAVSSAFDGIAAATARLTRTASAGPLRVSCVPALLSLWIVPRLGSFAAQYPNIRLSLTASNNRDDIRHADICVHYHDGDLSDCWFRKWSEIELFPVVSPTLINARPIRGVRDLAGHAMLHGDDGHEWQTWLAAADALDLGRGPQIGFSDARLATEAAIHGHGVALGDSVTASGLLARGQLVAPFDLSVRAADAFYVACRTEVRQAPVAQVFIDWLFAERDAVPGRGEGGFAGRKSLRKRRNPKS